MELGLKALCGYGTLEQMAVHQDALSISVESTLLEVILKLDGLPKLASVTNVDIGNYLRE